MRPDTCGVAPRVVFGWQAMQSHLTTPKAQEQACTALAALSLRMPENAEVIVANDGHTLIIQVPVVANASTKVAL